MPHSIRWWHRCSSPLLPSSLELWPVERSKVSYHEVWQRERRIWLTFPFFLSVLWDLQQSEFSRPTTSGRQPWIRSKDVDNSRRVGGGFDTISEQELDLSADSQAYRQSSNSISKALQDLDLEGGNSNLSNEMEQVKVSPAKSKANRNLTGIQVENQINSVPSSSTIRLQGGLASGSSSTPSSPARFNQGWNTRFRSHSTTSSSKPSGSKARPQVLGNSNAGREVFEDLDEPESFSFVPKI